jgi:hypothetical protein
MSNRMFPLSAAAAAAVLLACAKPAPQGAWLAELSKAPKPGAGKNWPLPPAQVEELLTTGAGEVRHREPVGAGVTGAERFDVFFKAVNRTLRIKWKAAPPGDVESWNNNPRKELAAYAIQTWFLPPEHYVVPTTVARCVRLADYRRLDPEAQPTLAGTQCVFGVQALWLDDVEIPEVLWDEERFQRDAAYARHIANFNVLSYLVQSRDTTRENVLMAKDPKNPRVFSVDNGIAFDPALYNPFLNNWDTIRVPALPRDTVERLRRLDDDADDELAVVAQFEVDEEGMLRSVRPIRRPDDDEDEADRATGVRWADGVLELGLTESEIDQVEDRLEQLLEDVGAGRIPLF